MGLVKEWIVPKRNKNKLIDQLLSNRGVEDKELFLNPDYNKLYHPSGLLNAEAMVSRLIKAIAQKESVAIFGDYDHDGTPAAVLLAEGITVCGGLVAEVYIPSRSEGYGLSSQAIDLLAKRKISLLITVDCGITAKPEVDYALTLGIETLVIDHHLVQEDNFPDSAIVVNPKQAADQYPFDDLAACGLAFKIIQLLGEMTGKITANQMKWYLDLVAISTICDMVPLVGENRILVYFGLKVLRQTKRPGLQQLIKAAEINPKTISTYTVGFCIGPRLNAPGRMDKASVAYDLLAAKDVAEAERLAIKLNNLNKVRQDELKQVLDQAVGQVEAENLQEKKVILVSGDGWPEGVVGLVAGRLTERYHRPSIVLSGQADGTAKGSARSLEEFHLVEVLQACQSSLIKFGGHAKAAGLTLASEQLKSFYDQLIEQADQRLDAEALKPKIKIDALLDSDELNLKTAEELEKLEPYGLGNNRPILMVSSMLIESVNRLGEKGNHLKMELVAPTRQTISAIAFNVDLTVDQPVAGQIIDAVGSLEINEWRGLKKLQFKLIDWRMTSPVSKMTGQSKKLTKS